MTCKKSPLFMTNLKLILVFLATIAVSDKSFSLLKSVKTYFPIATSSNRLNPLIIPYVCQSMTANLNLTNIFQELLTKQAIVRDIQLTIWNRQYQHWLWSKLQRNTARRGFRKGALSHLRSILLENS